MSTETPRFDTASIPIEAKPAPDHTNAVTAMNARRYRIPGDVVNRATAGLEDEERSLLRWLDRHAREHDLDLDALAGNLKKPDRTTYSRDSVYQALTGRRDGGLGKLTEAIADFKAFVEREGNLRKTGFIETTLTKKIWAVIRKSLHRHMVVFIFGASQIGKTTALDEYSRRFNHGETILARMPTGGAVTNFLEELAIALGISPQQRERELRRRILSSFDERMVLIVDECHQCFRSQYSNRPMLSLEFCREIHDRRRCGLVLCGTNVFRDEIKGGPRAGIMHQLVLRGLPPLQLPDRPTDAQLDAFAAGYGLGPAPDRSHTITVEATGETLRQNPRALQNLVIAQHGLGRWIAILQEAADLADDAKKKISWGHPIMAHALFEALGEWREN